MKKIIILLLCTACVQMQSMENEESPSSRPPVGVLGSRMVSLLEQHERQNATETAVEGQQQDPQTKPSKLQLQQASMEYYTHVKEEAAREQLAKANDPKRPKNWRGCNTANLANAQPRDTQVRNETHANIVMSSALGIAIGCAACGALSAIEAYFKTTQN